MNVWRREGCKFSCRTSSLFHLLHTHLENTPTVMWPTPTPHLVTGQTSGQFHEIFPIWSSLVLDTCVTLSWYHAVSVSAASWFSLKTPPDGLFSLQNPAFTLSQNYTTFVGSQLESRKYFFQRLPIFLDTLAQLIYLCKTQMIIRNCGYS